MTTSRRRIPRLLSVAGAVMGIPAGIVIAGTIALLAQQSGPATVRVAGHGASMDEARQDAIRQALQMSVRQLVLAQRVVQNDKLAMDQVASTMNGFVNRFTPLATRTESGVVTVEAEIDVAESRIENYLGTSPGGRTSVNANNVLGAIKGEQLARQARSEVALGLFLGFPQQVLQVTEPKISIRNDDPSLVDVTAGVRLDPAFVQRLWRGLDALGATSPLLSSSGSEGEFKALLPIWGYGLPDRDRSYGSRLVVCTAQSDPAAVNHFFYSGYFDGRCLSLPQVDPAVLKPIDSLGYLLYEVLIDGNPVDVLARGNAYGNPADVSARGNAFCFLKGEAETFLVMLPEGYVSIKGTLKASKLFENAKSESPELRILPFVVDGTSGSPWRVAAR